jgi:LysM repeat protein
MRRYFSLFTIWIILFLLFAGMAVEPVQAGAPETAIGPAPVKLAVAGKAGHADQADEQVASPSPTPAVIMAVVTVTPMPDGSMVHIVQPGQSLWAIAIAYGVKIADLVKLNKQLSPTNPVIFVGQKIIVRGTSLPTLSPTVTDTPFPVTGTPTLTKTLRPPTRTFAPSWTPAPTVHKVVLPDFPAFESSNRHALGIGLVTVCLLGLLAVVIGSVKKK